MILSCCLTRGGWLTPSSDNDMSLYNQPDQTISQISVYGARGMLIETQGPSWFYGGGSEHSVLYNYQLNNAKNVSCIARKLACYTPHTNSYGIRYTWGISRQRHHTSSPILLLLYHLLEPKPLLLIQHSMIVRLTAAKLHGVYVLSRRPT